MAIIPVHDTGSPTQNGKNLQSALASANGGDVIVLDPNIEYVGPIGLPPRGNTSVITIKTNNIENTVQLNSNGYKRVTPDERTWQPAGCRPPSGIVGGNANLAKITSAGSSNLGPFFAPALYTGCTAGSPGTLPINGNQSTNLGVNAQTAQNYLLLGIEFLCSPTQGLYPATARSDGPSGPVTLVQIGNNAFNDFNLNINNLGSGSGSFTLTWRGITTPSIAWSTNISTLAANIQSAMKSVWDTGNLAQTFASVASSNSIYLYLGFMAQGTISATTSNLSGASFSIQQGSSFDNSSAFFTGPYPGAPTSFPQCLLDYSQFPNNITFDRCLMWSGYPGPNGIRFDADNTNGYGPSTWGQVVRHMLQLNCKACTITNCYIYDNKSFGGADGQAISGINILGPVTATNNYFSATTENWFMGGALAAMQNYLGTVNATSPPSPGQYYGQVQLGQQVPGYTPGQSIIRYNRFAKDLRWNPMDPAYDGSNWSVKNVFEFKAGGNALIDQNEFAHSWFGVDQSGHCFLITPRAVPSNQGGPLVQCANITYSKNHIMDTYRCMEVIGIDTSEQGSSNKNAGLHTHDILVQDNLFEDIANYSHTGHVKIVGAAEINNSSPGQVTVTMDGSIRNGSGKPYNVMSDPGGQSANGQSFDLTIGPPYNRVWISPGGNFDDGSYHPDWDVATIVSTNVTGTFSGTNCKVGSMVLQCSKAHNLQNGSQNLGALVFEDTPRHFYIDGGVLPTQGVAGDNQSNMTANVVFDHNTVTVRNNTGGALMTFGGTFSYRDGFGFFSNTGFQFSNSICPVQTTWLFQAGNNEAVSDPGVNHNSNGTIPTGSGAPFCYEELLADGTSGFLNNLWYNTSGTSFKAGSLTAPSSAPSGAAGSDGYLGSGSDRTVANGYQSSWQGVLFQNWNGGVSGNYDLQSSSPGFHTATGGDNVGCRNFTWPVDGNGPGGSPPPLQPSSTSFTNLPTPITTPANETVTVAVTGNSGTPTGVVNFVDGSSQAQVGLSGGQASTTFSSPSVGTHTVVATYSGDSTYMGSSSTGTYVVQSASAASIALNAPSPITNPANEVVTATVSGNRGTPTGGVNFSLDGGATNPVALVNGQCTITFPSPAVGNHTVMATYSGDSTYAGGATTSAAFVVQNSPSASIALSLPGPIVNPANETATATVTGNSGVPTGNVAFSLDSGSPLSENLSNGQTSITFDSPSVGTHSVVASYSGDETYSPTSTSGTFVVQNSIQTPSLNLSLPSPISSGGNESPTLTVSGSSGTPSGTVVFALDGGSGTTVNLSNGQASTTYIQPAVGTHTVTAAYSGDSTYASASTSGTFVVQTGPTASMTLQLPSPITSPANETVTATLTGNQGTPTGSVGFNLDGGTFTSVALSNGVASITFNSPAVGTHTVNATYSGDSTYSSVFGGGTFVVQQGSTSASLNLHLLTPLVTPEDEMATALLTGTSGTPTGTVAFSLDGSPAVTQNVVNGQASITYASPPTGTHTVTATYSGDSTYSGTTATGTFTVQIRISHISLALQTPITSPANETATATVSGAVNPPTGSVAFVLDGTSQMVESLMVNIVAYENFETGDFRLDASATNATIVTSPTLDGNFSAQLLRNSSVANIEIRQNGVLYYDLATAFYSFLFRTASSTGEAGIINFQDTSSGFKAALHLSSSGKLIFYPASNAGTLQGSATGSTTLSLNTTYTISATIGTGSNVAWEVRINGALELSSTTSGTADLGSVNNGSVLLGGGSPYTSNFYYDDIAAASGGYPVKAAQASATFTSPSIGTHTITAVYSGDNVYSPNSTSSTFIVNGTRTWTAHEVDAVGVADAVAISTQLTRTVSLRDVVGVADSLSVIHAVTRPVLLTEKIGVLDLRFIFSFGPNLFKLPFADFIGIADQLTVQSIALHTVQIADAVGVADLTTVTHHFPLHWFVSVTDAVGVAEVVKVSIGHVVDVVGVADRVSVFTQGGGAKAIRVSDSVGIADFPFVFVVALIDVVGIVDSLQLHVPVSHRILGEGIGVADYCNAALPPVAVALLLWRVDTPPAAWGWPFGVYGQEWWIAQGEDKQILFVPVFPPGNTSTWSLRWQLRMKDDIEHPVLTLDTHTGELVWMDPAHGILQMNLTADMTNNLTLQKRPWYWELARYNPGYETTVARGTVTIAPNNCVAPMAPQSPGMGEGAGLADTVAIMASGRQPSSPDAIGMADLPSTMVQRPGVTGMSLGFMDQVYVRVTSSRGIIDGVGMGEPSLPQRLRLTDSAGIADQISVRPPGGKTFSLTVSEAIGLTDSYQPLVVSQVIAVFSPDQSQVTITFGTQQWTFHRPVLTPWNYSPTGTTYWVAKNGNDANPGNQQAPFLTIGQGVSVAQAGDLVYVEQGTYVENLRIIRSGSASQPIIFSCAPGALGKVVVTPPAAYVTSGNFDSNFRQAVFDTNAGYIAGGGQYIWINGFMIQGPLGQAELITPSGFCGIEWQFGAGNGCQATNNVIFSNPHCGLKEQGDGGTNILMQSNVILANGTTSLDHGIYCPASSCTIAGNILFLNSGWGIHVYGGTITNVTVTQNVSFLNDGGILNAGSHCQIYNNTSANNITYGFSYYGNACDFNLVLNNIFALTQSGQNGTPYLPAAGDDQHNTDDYNDWYTTQPSGTFPAGAHELNVNPLFVNMAAGDFRLGAGSGCIGAGTPVGLPGQPNPPNVGAY